MVDKDHYGVHQTHCCFVDGCKYCDDDCPVVSGEIAQEYNCEDCPSYAKSNVIHTINVDSETYKKYEENATSFYMFSVETMNAQKGEIIVINEVEKNIKTEKSMRKFISDITLQSIGLAEGFAIMSFNKEEHYYY